MTVPRLPNIAIAGLAIETSTFHPGRTHAPAFHAQTGTASIKAYHAAVLGPSCPLASQANWHGALMGHALPGGTVTRTAFETLVADLITRLKTIVGEVDVLDGLWFDIHGAMCVEDITDAEAVLLAQIRAVVGPKCVVSASMDLHGNVSRSLVHGCDLLTCYRTAPHVDVIETRRRACENLLTVLARKGAGEARPRPYKAWVPIPILLPGEQTSTRDAPADEIYDAVPGVTATKGVLDAGVWVGYAWADEERNRAAVVVTGWEEDVVARGAERLARLFWERRDEFHFVAPTGSLDECLDTAVSSESSKRPFFVSDSGDNPTAGGSGDVTWGLARVLARPEFKSEENGMRVIYASLPGPEAVAVAVGAGVGAEVTVTAGAEVDDIHSGPLTMTGRVFAIKHGDKDAETEVVVRVGAVDVILTKLRKPYHKERDFTELGLRPREVDVVLVKIGYLEPELYAMAKGWMLALSPGGVDQDLARLGHRRVRRPIWPLDRGEWEEACN
ncbi:hypothetical protein N0V93_004539 [Gnomoniopsis smithogilvyi]|uniref:Microcystin LR degradation protein MlrC n=1 Tax=Gnomoniopsis smithogilvyi TaxID=1191159 RepID=A0A9W8YTX3_9PEZI|nr:hypothetical protein N0V93_004539 [Gnomoniopsis smithogilvyi]